MTEIIVITPDGEFPISQCSFFRDGVLVEAVREFEKTFFSKIYRLETRDVPHTSQIKPTKTMKNELNILNLKFLYANFECSQWKEHIKETYLVPNCLKADTEFVEIQQESIRLLMKNGTDLQRKTVRRMGIQLTKSLPSKWEEIQVNRHGYYINGNSIIVEATLNYTIDNNKNIFPTKELAEAILMLSQLSQLREVYRDGWKPNWNDDSTKFSISLINGRWIPFNTVSSSIFFSFQSEEIRDLFFKNFKNELEIVKVLYQ